MGELEPCCPAAMGQPACAKCLLDDLGDEGWDDGVELEHLGRSANWCGDDGPVVQPRVVEGDDDLECAAAVWCVLPNLDHDMAGIDATDGPSVADALNDNAPDTGPRHDGRVGAIAPGR
ncbi:hypothetical protein [Actinoplanes subtropicus]|uniref:hypothetical protein n=1 Tax=Actinoplanes subtropicus TaxID=543632 RepID=UPI0012F85001|nr:hypothetical protein [Actinoplanes subtropicus]